MTTLRELRNNPRLLWLVAGGIILIVAGFATAIVMVFSQLQDQGDAIDALARQRNTAVAEKAATADALGEANGKLLDSGQAPVIPAPVPTPAASSGSGTPGANGAQGPAPTTAQIRSAVEAVLRATPSLTTTQVAQQVAAYLRANPPPPGAPGEDGADGKSATDAQIAAAVARYLTSNPPPQGPAGTPGKDGSNGGDAPGVTEEQLAAAVATYLTANPPEPGTTGADGKPGMDGAPGVGVAATDLDPETCVLRITLTDGTVNDLGPICGATGPEGPAGPEGPPGPPGDVVTAPPGDPDVPSEQPTPDPTEEAQ